MKITGTSNVLRRSLTASRPELPSASWISARIRPGGLVRAIVDRLGPRAGNADDLVAEIFDQRLQIERNQCLVLDDQDIRGDLGRKLPAGLLDELAQRRGINVENSRRMLLGKPFDRDQEERLARLGRYLAEMAFRGEVASHRIGGAINGERIPDRGKQPKQGDPRQILGFQQIAGP